MQIYDFSNFQICKLQSITERNVRWYVNKLTHLSKHVYLTTYPYKKKWNLRLS